MNYQLHCGESAEILKQYPDNHFDSIVCDPPYMIGFLGKKWDAADIDMSPVFQECIRVLKPGGHILAFSAARTYHHLAITLEQAGFEIRDQIMWIYGSGFPKSQDVGKQIDRAADKKDPNYGSKKTEKQGNETVGDFSTGARCNKCNRTFNADIIKDCKEEPCGMRYTHQTEAAKQWAGWGTQLKPAHEPIVLARKPMTQTIAKNCQEWGVGAINIDACRVPYEDQADLEQTKGWSNKAKGKATTKYFDGKTDNTKTDYDQVDTFKEQGRFPANVIGDIDEPYQKYFYCPKVSRKERQIGMGDIKIQNIRPQGEAFGGSNIHTENIIGNNHPTVKPIELMKYLIKLVTPKNGRVLDPFNGSGSTGCAAVSLGHHYTGIDLDQHYIDISHKRIQAYNTSTYNDLFQEDE